MLGPTRALRATAAAARRFCSAARPSLLMETPSLVVVSLPVTPFAMNQYMIGCKETGEAALVDAGDEDAARWIATAESHGLTIRSVLQTHGHVDHVAGLAATKAALPDAPIYLHPADAMLLTTSPAQGLLFGFAISIPPRADRELADGETLRVGALSLTAMHTPGHSPGHVVFHVPDHELLFCGDLVFAGSVGRTDFPGCDKEAMQASLRRMLALPDATTLLPGHMGTSTVGEEAATNPFLVGLREWAAPRVS